MGHAMGVVSKTDENGNFIVEVCGQPNMKMARHFLEWQRPEKWGKRRNGTSSTELYMDLHFVGTANVFVYLPVLEKGEVRARALRPWECGASGRWHIHCAIELPSHFDAITLENMIRACWAKLEWGHGRILVRDGANAGWIDYMLKDRQKSEFDGFLDCIIIESLHNPIADA